MYTHVFIYVHVYISSEIENQKRSDEMGKRRRIGYIFIQVYICI